MLETVLTWICIGFGVLIGFVAGVVAIVLAIYLIIFVLSAILALVQFIYEGCSSCLRR